MLGEAAYKDLVQWAFAMQKQCLQVGREIIIQKASEINRYIFGSIQSVGSVCWRWCDLFMSLYGELTLRTVQVVMQVRSEASLEGLQSFF